MKFKELMRQTIQDAARESRIPFNVYLKGVINNPVCANADCDKNADMYILFDVDNPYMRMTNRLYLCNECASHLPVTKDEDV